MLNTTQAGIKRALINFIIFFLLKTCLGGSCQINGHAHAGNLIVAR
jgi:hypothetical protein